MNWLSSLLCSIGLTQWCPVEHDETLEELRREVEEEERLAAVRAATLAERRRIQQRLRREGNGP